MSAVALPDLAQAIEREHLAAHQHARSAIEHAIECGRLLLEAKAAVPHGEWLPWLEANVSFGARQAQKYARIADHADQIRTESSHLSINGALALLASPSDDDADAAINDALGVLEGHGIRKTVLDELLEFGCDVTPVSLHLPEGLPFEHWAKIGELLPNLEYDQVALRHNARVLLSRIRHLEPLQAQIREAVEAGTAMPDFAQSVFEQTCEVISYGRRWRADCASVTLAVSNANLAKAVEAQLKAQRLAVAIFDEDTAP